MPSAPTHPARGARDRRRVRVRGRGGRVRWDGGVSLALCTRAAGRETGYVWYVAALVAGSLVVYVTMPETRDAATMADAPALR